MKKILLLFLFFVVFSCMKSEVTQHWYENKNAAVDAQGLVYYFLDQSRLDYCSGGSRKFCRFLDKYDGTIWADAENYYSDFSDIKFSNNLYFISFYNLDNSASYCEGWKVGETTYDRIKWNIRIKRDEWDLFWFDYDYYGFSEEIEYTISYKYEVIDDLLHFSRTKIEKNNSKDVADTGEIDQTFIFSPSKKNYSKDLVDTGEIIVFEGCMFY